MSDVRPMTEDLGGGSTAGKKARSHGVFLAAEPKNTLYLPQFAYFAECTRIPPSAIKIPYVIFASPYTIE